jgi:hypothetical protein
MGNLSGGVLLGDYMNPKMEDTDYDPSRTFDESKILTWT